MNRTSVALSGRLLYRARATAWLVLAVIAAPLVPVPAALIAIGRERIGAAVGAFPALAHTITSAIPGFAVPAFVFGCGIGVALHMQLSSSEWLGDTAARQARTVGLWPAVVSGSIVGMLFASMALALAVAAPSVA